jgi:predicted Zn-dependent protease
MSKFDSVLAFLRSQLINALVLTSISVNIISCSTSKVVVDNDVFEPAKDYVRDADNLSQEEEDAIGQAVALRILANYPALNNEAINSYVNAVGQTVVAASPRAESFSGYKFLVLDTQEINAMAAPGGYIFISRGFFEKLQDEDALAAVLAHEVSHISKRHALAAIQPSNFADYVAVGSSLGAAVDCSSISQQLLTSFTAAAADVYSALAVAGYSKDQEYEADREAIKVLESAGYNSEGLKQALLAISDTKLGGGWFSTHPSPQSRLTQSTALIRKIDLAELGYEDRKKRFIAVKKYLRAS